MMIGEKEAKTQKEASEKLQKEVEIQMVEIAERTEIVQTELGEAGPALEKARTAVKGEDKMIFFELKSMFFLQKKGNFEARSKVKVQPKISFFFLTYFRYDKFLCFGHFCAKFHTQKNQKQFVFFFCMKFGPKTSRISEVNKCSPLLSAKKGVF